MRALLAVFLILGPSPLRASDADDARAPLNAALYRTADALHRGRAADGACAQAAEKLETALRTSPLDVGLLWRFARARACLGDRAKRGRSEHFLSADQALRTALDIEPDNVDARFWLAFTSLRRGRYAAALEQTEKAVGLAPKDGAVRFLAGDVYWNVPRLLGGDRQRALTEYEKAAELSSRRGVYLATLAQAYSDLGRTKEAVSALQRLDKLSEAEDAEELQARAVGLERLRRALPR
jgi:tetratricopeptide (TPR) repeat protein